MENLFLNNNLQHKAGDVENHMPHSLTIYFTSDIKPENILNITPITVHKGTEIIAWSLNTQKTLK